MSECMSEWVCCTLKIECYQEVELTSNFSRQNFFFFSFFSRVFYSFGTRLNFLLIPSSSSFFFLVRRPLSTLIGRAYHHHHFNSFRHIDRPPQALYAYIKLCIKISPETAIKNTWVYGYQSNINTKVGFFWLMWIILLG